QERGLMLGRARTIGVRRWLPPLAIVVALLGAWELAARLDVIANALHLEPFLVPAPSDIAQALRQDRGALTDNPWLTLPRARGSALRARGGRALGRVEGPTALPYFFSGAKIAVAVAVIGAVFGEWAGSSSGLGHLIQEASAQLQTARTFAAVVVLSAVAIVLFAALSALERRVAWWGQTARRT